MSRASRFLPLVVLVAIIGALLWRLANPADTIIRSKLEGQPVPAFALPAAIPGKPGLASATLATGNPRLLNIFASWCVPCIGEAPVLDQLKRRGVQIDAIAIRDRPEDVSRFLALHGDPFDRIASDTDSRVQLALGSSGVPETFVIDGKGIIRYQHVGPIEHDQIRLILAELEKAE
jgi:cytochrome c biogenesis protein CcmG/thiol:disulfide interchange protein DsbE